VRIHTAAAARRPPTRRSTEVARLASRVASRPSACEELHPRVSVDLHDNPPDGQSGATGPCRQPCCRWRGRRRWRRGPCGPLWAPSGPGAGGGACAGACGDCGLRTFFLKDAGFSRKTGRGASLRGSEAARASADTLDRGAPSPGRRRLSVAAPDPCRGIRYHIDTLPGSRSSKPLVC